MGKKNISGSNIMFEDKIDEAKCPQCGGTRLARYKENPTNDPSTIKLMCLDCFIDFFDLRDSITLSLPEAGHIWN
jgi:hypothetical protein